MGDRFCVVLLDAVLGGVLCFLAGCGVGWLVYRWRLK